MKKRVDACEYFYNLSSGDLLIGQAAVAEVINTEGPYGVLRLDEVLCSDDVAIINGMFDHLVVDGWDADDYEQYGRWLLRVIQNKNDTITYKIINKAYYMGIGPSRDRIVARYGNLWKYRRRLGVEVGRTNNRYSHWGVADYVQYASRLADTIGKRPTRDDYHKNSVEGNGPSVHCIYELFGSIGGLNEAIGYPDITKWEDHEYINWGADVREANSGMELTQKVLSVVSKKDRGPSFRTVYAKFGSLVTFQDRVADELASRLREKSEKAKVYEEMIALGELPIAYKELKEDELLHVAAKYITAYGVLQNKHVAYDQKLLRTAALLPASKYVAEVIKRYKEIKLADIELMALQLDLFDDIWPELRAKRLAELAIDVNDIKVSRKGYLRRLYAQNL